MLVSPPIQNTLCRPWHVHYIMHPTLNLMLRWIAASHILWLQLLRFCQLLLWRKSLEYGQYLEFGSVSSVLLSIRNKNLTIMLNKTSPDHENNIFCIYGFSLTVVAFVAVIWVQKKTAPYRECPERFSGMKFFRAWSFFSLIQPKPKRVSICSTNKSNRSIFVRLLFLLFTCFHFKVIQKSLYHFQMPATQTRPWQPCNL